MIAHRKGVERKKEVGRSRWASDAKTQIYQGQREAAGHHWPEKIDPRHLSARIVASHQDPGKANGAVFRANCQLGLKMAGFLVLF
jgi:hypothetical protein